MLKLRIILALSILGALAIGALWLLVPAPPGAEAAAFYSPLGTPLTLVDLGFAIGGALLFLRALRNFKASLKPAYTYIAFAQLSLGVLTLFYPYVEYYNLWGNVLLDMATYLPYLISSILSYLGLRQFGRIIGLTSHTMSLRLIGAVLLGIWFIHAFIPHVEIFEAPEYVYDLFEIAIIIPAVFYGAAAYLAYRLLRRAGKDYRKPFGWLTVGLTLQWLTCLIVFGFDIFGYDNWLFNSRAYYVFPVIFSDLSLLLAAYQFSAVGLPRKAVRPDTPVTSIDLIIFVADMAADQQKIRPYLDPLRTITANLQPGQPLTPQDQQALSSVYLNIEHYLSSLDPMRSIDRQDLRQRLVAYFNLDHHNQQTFWPLLATSSSVPIERSGRPT